MNRRSDVAARYQAGPGRRVGLALVVALHLGLVYALVTALGVLPAPRGEVVSQLTPVVPTEPVKPVIPLTAGKPNFGDITIPKQIPPRVGDINVAKTSEFVVPDAAGAQTGNLAPAAVVTIPSRIDQARSVKPPYPAMSRRLEEHGKVVVNVLVDEAGNVLDARVATGSGFARLDAAAIEGVKRGYHFIPGTIGGKPASMWQQIVVVFELKDGT